MKKIIKQGKPEKYIHTCSKCGCVFTYELSDLVGFRIVDCPCCKNKQSTEKDTLYEKTSEQETPRHHSCKNEGVSQIARMQRQIDTFKAALLHINERINNGNKCNLVYTDSLDDNDKHIINNIIRFIDQKATENPTEQPKNTNHEHQEQETTVKNEEYKKTGKTYNIYKLTRREQEGKELKQCPHFQFNIGSEYCKTCRYFVSHDYVDRTVKCSYPNPVPDPSLGLFKNNQQ